MLVSLILAVVVTIIIGVESKSSELTKYKNSADLECICNNSAVKLAISIECNHVKYNLPNTRGLLSFAVDAKKS